MDIFIKLIIYGALIFIGLIVLSVFFILLQLIIAWFKYLFNVPLSAIWWLISFPLRIILTLLNSNINLQCNDWYPEIIQNFLADIKSNTQEYEEEIYTVTYEENIKITESISRNNEEEILYDEFIDTKDNQEFIEKNQNKMISNIKEIKLLENKYNFKGEKY